MDPLSLGLNTYSWIKEPRQCIAPHCPRIYSVALGGFLLLSIAGVSGGHRLLQSPERAFLSGLFTKNSCPTFVQSGQ